MHTACGRSESKHLRPTPNGHAEGAQSSPYAGLGHPSSLGAAQSAVTQDPAASSLSSGKGRRALGGPLPSSVLPLGLTQDPGSHLVLESSAQESGVLHFCVPPQPYSWGWGGSGGSLGATRPLMGSPAGAG